MCRVKVQQKKKYLILCFLVEIVVLGGTVTENRINY